MRKILLSLALLLFAVAGTAVAADTLPRANTVTMIDLGADFCVPCKMMAPILKKLETEYSGKADVSFIDISKNQDATEKYRIHVIPTQIFYNKEGKEVGRHEGFLEEKTIRGILDNLLGK